MRHEGSWLGETVEISFAPPPDLRQLERDYGLTYRPPGAGTRGGQWSFRFDRAVREFSLELRVRTPATWTATAADGATTSGTVTGDDVLSELRRREGISGVDEKASRK